MKTKTWPGAVLFDLDGTLVETLPDIRASLNAMLAARGAAPLDPETVRSFIGKGTRNSLNRALRARGFDPTEADIDAALVDFTRHYDSDPVAGSFVYDGVVPLLENLRQHGHRMAVCTNKQKGTAMHVLDALGIGGYFDVVVGGDEVEFRKPDPRHIDVVLDRMGASRADALFIGDSENDIEAAVAAGVPCVAVSFGYCNVPFDTFGPVPVVDRYDEIWPLIPTLRP